MTAATDTLTVANRLVELCKQGRNREAIDELYAESIVSVEAMDCPDGEAEGMPRVMEGIDAIRGKNQWWTENHEVHGGEVLGPYHHAPDRFAVFLRYDVTFKPANQRIQMEEVGVYTVRDGKIVREEYFYTM